MARDLIENPTKPEDNVFALVGKHIDERDEIDEKDFKIPTPGTEEHLAPFLPTEQDYAALTDSEKKFSAQHSATAPPIDSNPYTPKANWRPSDPIVLPKDHNPKEDIKQGCKTWREWLMKYEPDMFTSDQIDRMERELVVPESMKEEYRERQRQILAGEEIKAEKASPDDQWVQKGKYNAERANSVNPSKFDVEVIQFRALP